jgi:hypothetical protein
MVEKSRLTEVVEMVRSEGAKAIVFHGPHPKGGIGLLNSSYPSCLWRCMTY